MSLSEVSIRRPVFAWMLMAALIVFGAISFKRMGISQMPDVNFPVINIALRLDNAAPEVMEADVVDIVEDTVMGIEGLKTVSSTASQGTANITCEFELNHDINVALQEVQTRIQQVQNRLPVKLYPPVITKTNPEDQPILWVMLTADPEIPLYQQMIYARNTLKDQLTSLSGVGNVIFGGYVEPNLRVWIDQKKLYRYHLTSADVLSAIQAEQIEQPAGRIENSLKEFNVRVLGETSTPEEFGKIQISTRGGAPNYQPLPLNQVARIEEGISDLRAISRFNGKSAVGLGIIKQHGANAVEVANTVKKKLDQIRPTLLKGYHLNTQLDTTDYIKDSVNELNFTLLLSALLTSIICYLFLGSWSSTINVLLAIPTSVVGAFLALYFCGFTLNTFTLLGLSLAIGIVVDDAIMMLENIVRHHEMGKSRKQAALEGSQEITFAAFAATLAIAAIFIPVIFMKGVIGRFFYQYGITVTVAVFLSLLEALTLTPMRCSQFLHSTKESASSHLKWVDQFMGFLSSHYQRLLHQCLRWRGRVVLGTLLFFLGSLVVLGQLRQELIPEQDQSLFVLNIKNPVGTSIWASDEIFHRVENYLIQQPEIQDRYTTIGNFQNNDIVNAGTIYVMLKSPKERKFTQREVMDRTRNEVQKLLPQSQVFAQDLSLTGFSATRGFPIEFTVEGPDWSQLSTHAMKMFSQMKSSPFFVDVSTDYQDGMPEIQIIPNREWSSQHGVSINQIGTEVSTLMGGQIFTADTQYPKDGHRYTIRVRSEPTQHSEPAQLDSILLRNNRGANGELVDLQRTSKTQMGSALQLISRMNRQRAIPIYANVVGGQSQQGALEEVERLAQEILPSGYHIRVTGSAKAFREAFASLIFALILGIVVAYMILASQFNSFIHPVTVLMALPFSLSGALFSLYFTHQSVNLFSMIGLILLMGIVKKNSILLVDFTNQKRAEGLEATEALLHACPIRLRPILMTSVATVAGAIPAALAFGPGSETRVPMSISIIGGVTVSTLLTLFVVPCVYSFLTRWERPETDEDLRQHLPPSEASLRNLS